jgi:type IV secretory pathway ATPase VirB11/archaellum biosynthesis ATPase
MSMEMTNGGLSNELLNRALEPFSEFYDREGVEEIAINQPGEVWVKMVGGSGTWIRKEAPEITFKLVLTACRIFANITEQDFDRDQLPILAGTLPGGHRFQAVVGSNVRYDMGHTQGVAICIRRYHQGKKMSLSSFKLEPGRALAGAALAGVGHQRYSDFAYDDLIATIEHGEAVLISGATSTGKTTFLNALINYIPLDRRVITVEDAREVLVAHPNHVHFVVSRTTSTNQVGYAHILDSVVRLTPDVIICGEISITNAKSIYRLMTTGHSNFMATIHAETPEMALRAFWQNLTQTDPHLDARAAIEIISRTFGRIVQIDRSTGERMVTNVDIPQLMDRVAKTTVRNAVEEEEQEVPIVPMDRLPFENSTTNNPTVEHNNL